MSEDEILAEMEQLEALQASSPLNAPQQARYAELTGMLQQVSCRWTTGPLADAIRALRPS